MTRYLTEKTKPGKGRMLLEKAVLIALFALLAIIVYVAVYGYLVDGLSMGHVIMCVPAVLLVLAMTPFTEQMRARKHAELIVRALMQADEGMPFEELEGACGVRNAADVAMKLKKRGYLKEIYLHKGVIRLGAPPEEEEQEEIRTIFRD